MLGKAQDRYTVPFLYFGLCLIDILHVGEYGVYLQYFYFVLDIIVSKQYIQGVNKVRRHFSFTYNFRISVHLI